LLCGDSRQPEHSENAAHHGLSMRNRGSGRPTGRDGLKANGSRWSSLMTLIPPVDRSASVISRRLKKISGFDRLSISFPSAIASLRTFAQRFRTRVSKWAFTAFTTMESIMYHESISWSGPSGSIGICRHGAQWGTGPLPCSTNWNGFIISISSTTPPRSIPIFPFFVSGGKDRKGYVELPYTLPQDFTLFVLLQHNNTDIWKRKLDWVVGHGGIVLMNTHPDYMHFGKGTPGYEEYPARFYEHFLSHIENRYAGQYWHALPREVASWYRNKIFSAAAGSGHPSRDGSTSGIRDAA
jgi:hypothetical protein